MSKIMVDIDELQSKLDAMIEDDYVTVELDIKIDDYDYIKELKLAAVSIESTNNVSYGSIPGVESDIIELD